MAISSSPTPGCLDTVKNHPKELVITTAAGAGCAAIAYLIASFVADYFTLQAFLSPPAMIAVIAAIAVTAGVAATTAVWNRLMSPTQVAPPVQQGPVKPAVQNGPIDVPPGTDRVNDIKINLYHILPKFDLLFQLGLIHELEPDWHFDWFVTPTNRWSSRCQSRFELTMNELAQLKADPQYMRCYRRAVIRVAQSWGFDLENNRIVNPAFWRGNTVRIGKVLHSLSLFGENDLHQRLSNMVHLRGIRFVSDHDRWSKNYVLPYRI